MKISKLLLLLTIAVFATSCTNSSENSAKNTIAWQGVYSNVLPSTDCDGIQTSIELKSDQTYQMVMKYLGVAEEKILVLDGAFDWEKSGNQIKLNLGTASNEVPTKYLVKNNTLIQLDSKGKEFANSELYSLEKVSSIIGKKWSLVELNGRSIEIDNEFLRQPFFMIDSDYRVSGVGICNNFFGGVTLRSGNAILFSAMGSTMMACLDMADVEYEYLAAFSNVAKYSVTDDELILFSDNGAIVTKFKLTE